ncbi:MAG: sulfatase-like hydrolase/transferase, partial [Planctomycetes bacterium]|nr:sulfatase-like hydrolase/transferase [Planctomycetota bacterium]
DRGHDAYRGDLNRRCVTIAEALRPAGYRNYMAGKWHVTRHVAPDGPKHNWPLQRGFDRFYGTITGAGSFFDPATLCRGNTYVTPENDAEYRPERFYYTDAISDQAVRFVREHEQQHEGRPFFLYVAYTTAHWPMHALEQDIANYQDVYDDGFEPIRAERLARARELGVLDASWPMSAAPTPWAETPHHAWETRNMQVYAAMVDRMDQGIARIVAELERQQKLDDTLFVYLQDNGGCAENWGRGSNADEVRGKTYPPLGKDGLQTRIWPPMQTRDGRPVRSGPEAMAGAEDTFVGYGRGWANVSNTPFRGYKHEAYEGGISTPFVVHWPNGMPAARRGAIADAPCHLIDVLPTLLAVAGAAYPREHADQQVQPLEGISLLPVLRGEPAPRPAPLCFEHHGNLGLRDGRWKIVSRYRDDRPVSWELYDMVADRTESTDLAAQHPERVRAMAAAWQRWADRVGVQPWPFPARKQR